MEATVQVCKVSGGRPAAEDLTKRNAQTIGSGKDFGTSRHWHHTAKLIGYILLMFLPVYMASRMIQGGMTRSNIIQAHLPSIDRFAACKLTCPYCTQDGNAIDINMTSFQGYGRTGNYFISLNKAMNLAVACKKTIELPRTDDHGMAFAINSSCHILDFSQRIGPENMFCKNITFPIQGDAKFFWFLKDAVPDLSQDTREEYKNAMSSIGLDPCLRQYLGLCSDSYCQFQPSHSLNSTEGDNLVAHLREGDIFLEDFSSNVPAQYGQPPLSYYLQAIYHKKWQSITIVTQPGHAGPIRSGLLMLNRTLDVPIHLQMSTWYDDLKTLLCAPALVASKSSLEELFPLGFASIVFGYRCYGNSTLGREYYKINVDSYSPFQEHTNSPMQWLETLLHSSPEPERC